MALAPCCLEASSSRTARAVLSRSVLLAALNSTYWLRKYWSMALASFGNATPGKNSFADSGVFAGHNPTRLVKTKRAEKVLFTGLQVYSSQALPARPVHGRSTR